MKPKQKFKIAVDILMTGLLFVLMAFSITGQLIHEWAGAAMFVLFIAHHILNVQWAKNLFKGKYTAVRAVQTMVDLFLLLAMLALMVSGIRLSRYVFPFLPALISAALARQLHLVASYWGFLLMSLHLGLHWGMVLGMLRKGKKSKTSVMPRILAAGIGVYGIWAFFHHQIWMYLFSIAEFAFFDYERPTILFFADHAAMMGLFILLAYGASKLLRKKRGGQK